MDPRVEQIIDRYYPAGTPLRDIFLNHSQSVARLALELNGHLRRPLPEADVESAALLHDVGIFLTHAPSIECRGSEPYIRHGMLGADLLRSAGLPELWARVCERHTGSGLTAGEIAERRLPLDPERDYMPRTMLEKLVCYADKFFSKSGSRRCKNVREVEDSMLRHGAESLERFKELEGEIARESVMPPRLTVERAAAAMWRH